MLGKPSLLCQLLLACCVAAQLARLAVAAPTVAAAAAASAALATAPGGQLTIALQLEGDSAPSSLQLQRRDVWSPGAQVVVHTAAGVSHQAPPPTRWFAGSLAGVRGSSVMLAVHPDGRMAGTAARPGSSWSLTAAAAGPTTAAAGSGRLVGHKLTNVTRPTTAAAAAQRPSRRCGNKPRPVTVGQTTAAPVAAAATATQVASTGPLQATIAIDTDSEFCALFGSVQDAADYVALLVAYLDVVYSREVGVGIRLGRLELRPNKTATDYPATYNNLGRVETALAAVTTWWNTNRQDVPRALVIYLSGQTRVKDVAMAGDEVLCDWYKAKQNNQPSSNEAYGFVSWIDGDFRWNGINNPAGVTWDVFNFAHEVGHIFGAPHTHEFCNILGNPNTVDDCARSDGYPYLGQWKSSCPQPNGYGKLPNCTAQPTAFGGGPGTIMSYCDMVNGRIQDVSMTLGLNHPCGNAPDRVVQVIKNHVALRNRLYPSCLVGGPVPSPSPSPSPSPKPEPAGSWTDPLVIAALPYTSPAITKWALSSQLPMHCNDAATPLDTKGKRTSSRAVKVLRWRSGAAAKGTLTVHSCGLTTKGSPMVSVRATINTANPLAGPWTCEGSAIGGCGKQAGFRLTVTLRPNTTYDIILSSLSTTTTQVKLSATAQTGKLVPWPAPAGSWLKPHQIPSLPFTTATFNTFFNDTVPAACNDMVLRTRDSITKYTAPARVFRLWSGVTGRLNINSCAYTRAGDKPNISLRSTTNAVAPLNGPWQCIGLPRTATTSGCASGSGFNVTIPANKNTWYYLIVSHSNAGVPPSVKFNVKRS